MFKKLQTWLVKTQEEQKKRQELVNAQKYYQLVRTGSYFLQFIKTDMEQMKKNQVNRHMRRRFEASLDKFELNAETIQYYQTKSVNILNWIKGQLNSPKPRIVKTNPEIKKPEEKKNA